MQKEISRRNFLKRGSSVVLFSVVSPRSLVNAESTKELPLEEIKIEPHPQYLGDKDPDFSSLTKPPPVFHNTSYEKQFELNGPYPRARDARLTLETIRLGHTEDEYSSVFFNDILVAELDSGWDEYETWRETVVKVPVPLIQRGKNKIKIVSGRNKNPHYKPEKEDESANSNRPYRYDDFLFRNLKFVLFYENLDTDTIDQSEHHIGDNNIPLIFRGKERERISYGTSFSLEKIPLYAEISLEDMNLHNTMSATEVFLNNSLIGNLTRRHKSDQERWYIEVFRLPFEKLKVGANNLFIVSGANGGNYWGQYPSERENFLIRNIKLNALY